jgi:hypothetical protein
MSELLVNHNFDDGSTGWTASGGFGTYSYTSSNQIAVLDGIAYFTYVSRTLSQIVNVSDSIENINSFVCILNIRHRQKGDDGGYTQVDTYNFELVFKDSSNNVIISKRTPSSGSSQAPKDFTDVELRLDRNEIENFNNIHFVEVKVTGIDTGFWNGNHGPMVDYISLQAGVTPPYVTEGLILYYDPSNSSSYSGTGTALIDLSGNNLSGILSNVSHISPAFIFNGSSSTISTLDNALLEPESGDWTIEIWVNYSVFNISNCLMSKTMGGNAADWGYGIRTSSTGSTYMEMGNGTTSVNSSSYVVSTNTWYQIVGVWTNIETNSIEFYVNGISQGSKSHSFASVKNTTRPLFIGSFDGGAVFGQWINGKVGIVRIYDRALTSAQIIQNFDNDKSKYLMPTPEPTPEPTPSPTPSPSPSPSPTPSPTPSPNQAQNFQPNKIKQNHGKLTRGIYKRFWNIIRDVRN